MKKTLSICFWLTAFAVCSTNSYGQQNNTLSIVSAIGNDNLIISSPGAPGFQSEGQVSFGLNYVRHISGLFSIETGIEYTNVDLLLNHVDAYDPTFTPEKTGIKMISVPVYANFTFFKYVFLNAGLSADFEIDNPPQEDRIAPKQNGIGVFLGVGGKYTFSHITVFANPFAHVHAVVPFGSSDNGNLMGTGVKFGLGYSF